MVGRFAADLWFLPLTAQTRWLALIDWQLNFQLSKASFHKAATPSHHMQNLLEHYEWTYEPPVTDPNASLVIACAGRLPTQACAFIPFSGDLKKWLSAVALVRKNWPLSSARIFLPTEIPISQAETSWKKICPDLPSEFSTDEDCPL